MCLQHTYKCFDLATKCQGVAEAKGTHQEDRLLMWALCNCIFHVFKSSSLNCRMHLQKLYQDQQRQYACIGSMCRKAFGLAMRCQGVVQTETSRAKEAGACWTPQFTCTWILMCMSLSRGTLFKQAGWWGRGFAAFACACLWQSFASFCLEDDWFVTPGAGCSRQPGLMDWSLAQKTWCCSQGQWTT